MIQADSKSLNEFLKTKTPGTEQAAQGQSLANVNQGINQSAGQLEQVSKIIENINNLIINASNSPIMKMIFPKAFEAPADTQNPPPAVTIQKEEQKHPKLTNIEVKSRHLINIIEGAIATIDPEAKVGDLQRELAAAKPALEKQIQEVLKT